MNDYVELHRRFVPFDDKTAGERDDLSYFLSSSFSSKSWDDILANRCTVIIAEALNGKTTEMQQRTHALRRAGAAAFFCRLDILANFKFDKAIEIGTAQEFEEWKASDSRGYFFLDSVDEAKLASAQDFERAILNFVDAIESFKDRISIFISTRPHAWQAYADRAMLERRLALGSASDDSQPSEDPDEFAGEEIADGTSDPSNAGKRPPISILKMAPLTKEQVKTFANARQVADVDAFLEAIERADADVFASTPADLRSLVGRWKKQQRIGRYSEVVDDNIALKLSEPNPKHQQAATIAPDRAREGAMTLAAALTLTQKTSLLLPDQPIDEALRGTSLDPNEVLKGWTPAEVQSLLGRGLFDESLYGTVRFHHRTAREYLTGRWFERLLENRKNRRTVERLFFAEPYATQPTVAIAATKPIVGWLAVWDQRVRDKTRHIDPKVLLEFGDASALDAGTRQSLLKKFAERYKDRNFTPISLHVREVRRLADPRLSVTISQLLATYRGHDDVRNLLLRIIREGKVADCVSAASTFAVDAEMDVYTRSLAVEAVGLAGNLEERRYLASKLVAQAPALDRLISASAIETLWPDALSDADVHLLFAQAPTVGKHSVDQLAHQLGVLAQQLPSGARALEMLRKTAALLIQPPLHSDYLPISRRHDWLLPFAWSLARCLAESGSTDKFDDALLTVISLSAQADHLDRYTGEVGKEANALLQSNRALWYSLFWHEVGQTRLRKDKPVNDWWMAIRSPALMPFEENDGARFFDDLKSRSLPDDRLIALSVLMTTYGRSGKPAGLLERIRAAVASDRQLEDALNAHLSPPPRSKEAQKVEREIDEHARKRKTRKLKDEKSRAAWIKRLRMNPAQVGDLSIAATGKVWNNTLWLFNEIRKKRNRATRWTVGDWEVLQADFGSEVAKHFRDFCVAFWRLYKPTLRSETGTNTNSTPWAVIVGLSGLAMQARTDPHWAKTLSDDEASLATRYAFRELNQLPSWFTTLFQERSQIVKPIILNEIRWQFSQPDPKASSIYILSRLRWTAQDLGHALRDDIIALVEANADGEPTALAEALTIILRDPSAMPARFKQFAAQQATKAAPERRALWLSVLLCVDSKRGIAALEKWVNAGSDKAEREKCITEVLENIWGDSAHSLNSQHRDFTNVETLTRLLKLTYGNVRLDEDISHDDVYSPGPRDHAQRARGHLLQLLSSISGKPTFDALRELATLHKGYPSDNLLNMAERRAEADVEHGPWNPSDVAAFADEVEHNPSTQRDLFETGLSRLDDLKLEFEEGDESEAALLRKVDDEIQLRLALANRLRNAAHGKYTTGSEEELADIKRTDIRLHNPAVDARIPIEVKIAGKWQAKVLKERLRNQLIGQYMREARYGIFLVVNRGAEGDLQTWKPSGKRVGFVALIDWLASQTKALLAKNSKIDGLQVVGIDLLKRDLFRPRKAIRKRLSRRDAVSLKRSRKRRSTRSTSRPRASIRRRPRRLRI